MAVRATTTQDAQALADIYGHAVLHGLGTFEEDPPSPAEMDGRRLKVTALGLPHLVAEREGRVLGFAYAAPFRPRPGYRWTAEDSVYVHPDAQGAGVGRELLGAVVAACEALGLHRLVAVVGDSGNAASIRLHESLGFAHAGLVPAMGFKHGRWVDVVWMHRGLNAAAGAPPACGGLQISES